MTGDRIDLNKRGLAQMYDFSSNYSSPYADLFDTETYLDFYDHDSLPIVGSALVRASVVPIPPAIYRSSVNTYALMINTPNVHTNYKNVMYLKGDFGLAFLYFVPESETMGANRKRSGRNVFDVYYKMSTWSQCVDLLRNEKPVYFFYDDSTNTAGIKTSDEPIGEEES